MNYFNQLDLKWLNDFLNEQWVKQQLCTSSVNNQKDVKCEFDVYTKYVH